MSIDTITIANIFSTHSVLRNEDTSLNTDIDEGFILLGLETKNVKFFVRWKMLDRHFIWIIVRVSL